jgi:hypothetical protein
VDTDVFLWVTSGDIWVKGLWRFFVSHNQSRLNESGTNVDVQTHGRLRCSHGWSA